jgi:hypothetical protein
VWLVGKDQPDYPNDWVAGPNPSSNLMLPRKHQTTERMMGRTERCTVWLLIDSMILPQVHLVYSKMLLIRTSLHWLSSPIMGLLPMNYLPVGTDYILSSHKDWEPTTI